MTPENPYSPPSADSEQPIVDQKSGGGWVRGLSGVQLLIVVVGLVGVMWDIESIMASGPCLAFVSLILMLVGWRSNRLAALICGLSGPSFALFISSLIYLNEWSPSEAFLPVLGLGLFYAMGLFGGVAAVFNQQTEVTASKAEKLSTWYLSSRRCSWCRLLAALCRDRLVSITRVAVVDSGSCYPAGSNISLL